MSLREELERRAADRHRGWRVEIHRLDERLASRLPDAREVVDEVPHQLEELARDAHPSQELSAPALAAAVASITGGAPAAELGAWVFYPWSGRLVHVLPAGLHRRLLASRNRFKISDSEQERLARARVGVVGLSVGRAVAICLAMEGVGELRLADLDTLSLSNLNRLAVGCGDLGLNKAVSAARQVVELDPWREVKVFEAGISEDNLDAFLLEGGALDVVVEECDSLPVKFLVRERARAHRLPVLMETSDRGLLDVERFDREPHRPSFHGLVGDLDSRAVTGLSKAEEVPLIARILGGERITPRAAASLLEMRERVRTWPQLASDVAVGGGTVATAVRRLLRGDLERSGRYSVDVGRALDTPEDLDVAPWWEQTAVDETLRPRQLPALASVRAVDASVIRRLVACAILAPSAHNAQPWRFLWDGRHLDVALDSARLLPALDVEDGGSICGLGAAVENVVLAAPALGLSASVSPGKGDVVARIRFSVQPGLSPDPLLAQLPRRCTSRESAVPERIGDGVLAALDHEACGAGGGITLLTERSEIALAGELLAATSRIAFTDRAMHDEIFGGFRWTPEEVLARRDGLDVSTLVPGLERAGLRLVAHWPAMAALSAVGGGAGLEQPTRKSFRQASAVAVVWAPGRGRSAWLTAGRVLQRVWLRATALGLWFYPYSGLSYLVARHERAGPTSPVVARIAPLVADYRRLFPVDAPRVEATLLRITLGGAPTTRSLRRPVDDVLTVL